MNDIKFHWPSWGSNQTLDSGKAPDQDWQMSANSQPFFGNDPGSRNLINLVVVAIALLCGLFASDTATAAARGKAAAKNQAQAKEVLDNCRTGLVLVEGKGGVASGFIADLKGRKVLVSNAHVLADIRNVRFKLLDNTPVKVGAAMVAVGHDILTLAVIEGGTVIPTATSVTTEVTFDDAVVVPGNAGGAGVVRPLRGTIVGIGPERLEVSAMIEPGSSGSPIIHLNTGKVIGVATYLKLEEPVGNGRQRTEIRRFGYRLDSVQKWEPVDWARFYAQADSLDKFRQSTRELAWAFDDMGSSSGFRRQKHIYESQTISSALDRYETALAQSPRNRGAAASNLLALLRTASQSSMVGVNAFTYDFFRRQYGEVAAQRKEIMEVFDKAIEMMR